MRCQLIAALSVFTFVGCSTPQHIEWHQRPDPITIAPNHSSLSVDIRTATADQKRQPKIDTSRSYASKGGKRYNLRISDNPYADQFKTNSITKSIFLVDPTRTPLTPGGDPQDVLLWESGEWLLHLTFISDPPFQPINARFRLHTGLYVFPFSGMPN